MKDNERIIERMDKPYREGNERASEDDGLGEVAAHEGEGGGGVGHGVGAVKDNEAVVLVVVLVDVLGDPLPVIHAH